MLDESLHVLLQNIICSISTEMGKLVRELRGELALIGKQKDYLESKCDEVGSVC